MEETKEGSPFAVVVTWAEGHGPENEADLAEAKIVCDEFYAHNFKHDEAMPLSMTAITIKRID